MQKKPACGFLARIFRKIEYSVPARSKNRLYGMLYNYLAVKSREEKLLFWNFGFEDAAPKENRLLLSEPEERYRYCIQLYDHVARAVDLRGKDILEVSCGCGGGSSFLMKHHGPRSVTGMDYSQNAVDFCKSHHSMPGLSFCRGNAESLPFESSAFDVVVNIEASHCFGSMERFLNQVERVLRPNGHFLFADFRHRDLMHALSAQIDRSGLKWIGQEIISSGVLKALEASHDLKMELIQAKAPRFLRNSFKYFWGTADSKRYDLFRSGEEIYFNYVLQKGLGGCPSATR
jgi:ubiquinone/menaquinone biosynthesis C-methylase UbiE